MKMTPWLYPSLILSFSNFIAHSMNSIESFSPSRGESVDEDDGGQKGLL